MPDRRKRIRILLAELCKQKKENGFTDGTLEKKLERQLRFQQNMLAFIAEVEVRKKRHSEDLRQYLCAIVPVLLRLGKRYCSKPPEYRAMYFYAIFIMSLGKDRVDDQWQMQLHQIIELILPDVIADSPYVRQNAIRAVFSIGNVRDAIHVVRILNEHPQIVNAKMLGDDLILFSGDHQAFAEALMSIYTSACKPVCVACLNYLSRAPGEVLQQLYYEMVYETLRREDTEGEVRMAAIRYFRAHFYEPAYEVLIRFLTQQKNEHYNFAAVAATALASYPSERTTQVMLSQLSNRDWFVRYNCAKVLSGLHINMESIIAQSTDPYAHDILIYCYESDYLKTQQREVVEDDNRTGQVCLSVY